jgi:hypothetical protein
MIAYIQFDYSARQKLVALAKDELALPQLKEIFATLIPADENLGLDYMWPEAIAVDMDTEGLILGNLGIEFIVKKFKGTMPLSAILPDRREPVTVYVQVPHIGLLAMNEVMVEENCCTDALQRLLDSGWRILCVCPPNAARRPDYILGRTRPEN